MQKAISGTEQMTEKAQRERDSYEAFMKEARKKFIDEANPYFRQEDNLAEVSCRRIILQNGSLYLL